MLNMSQLSSTYSQITENLLIWFKENDPFSSARDKNKLVSFSTGFISDKDHDDINPEKADAVGLELQKTLR